jgi:hypothetical protein
MSAFDMTSASDKVGWVRYFVLKNTIQNEYNFTKTKQKSFEKNNYIKLIYLGNYIKEKGAQFDLIVCNEDPCGLDCVGNGGFKYVSNGFFACIPGCVSLKRIIHPKTLDGIDFNSKFVNRQTGPYLLRAGINAEKDNVHVIDNTLIYPVWVNDTEYRQGEPNQCLEDIALLGKCLEVKYPQALALYYSGLGGTWSW